MSIWQRLSSITGSLAWTGSLTGLLRLLPGSSLISGEPKTGVTFTIGLVALAGKMAKADGVVTPEEIAAFNRVLSVPPEETANVRHVFDLATQDMAGFESYARQVAWALGGDREILRDVLEGLFAIASADGVVHEAEEQFLETVAAIFTIPYAEYAYTRALFVGGGDNPFGVLGLSPHASDAEIKARHRKLATENHPDRLIARGVPEELIMAANRKLAAINAAYDAIRKERGT